MPYDPAEVGRGFVAGLEAELAKTEVALSELGKRLAVRSDGLQGWRDDLVTIAEHYGSTFALDLADLGPEAARVVHLFAEHARSR